MCTMFDTSSNETFSTFSDNVVAGISSKEGEEGLLLPGLSGNSFSVGELGGLLCGLVGLESLASFVSVSDRSSLESSATASEILFGSGFVVCRIILIPTRITS